jgi:hypothetical protein
MRIAAQRLCWWVEVRGMLPAQVKTVDAPMIVARLRS